MRYLCIALTERLKIENRLRFERKLGREIDKNKARTRGSIIGGCKCAVAKIR